MAHILDKGLGPGRKGKEEWKEKGKKKRKGRNGKGRKGEREGDGKGKRKWKGKEKGKKKGKGREGEQRRKEIKKGNDKGNKRKRKRKEERNKKSEVIQSCLTLCDPMDCSLPAPVHGIFQGRRLECVSISFSKVSSRPGDWTLVSCIAGRLFTLWATGSPWPRRQIS